MWRDSVKVMTTWVQSQNACNVPIDQHVRQRQKRADSTLQVTAAELMFCKFAVSKHLFLMGILVKYYGGHWCSLQWRLNPWHPQQSVHTGVPEPERRQLGIADHVHYLPGSPALCSKRKYSGAFLFHIQLPFANVVIILVLKLCRHMQALLPMRHHSLK